MRELSSEAKAGKILILIGLIIEVIVTIILFIFSAFVFTVSFWWIFVLIFDIMSLIALILGIYAYKACCRGDFHRAGILGIVSGVLGNIIMLIGGILCLTSKEGKK